MRAAPAAQTAGGDIVLLEEQDRTLWDQAQIAEGLRLVEEALRMPGRPEPMRCRRRSPRCMRGRRTIEDTDWPQIAGLYEVLLRISPSPVIELNHAAAMSMVDGPARALDLVDALEARGGLDGYELLPAVRADLLRRLGRRDAAREAYLAATAATQLEPLRRLYARRLKELDGEINDAGSYPSSLRAEAKQSISPRRKKLDCFVASLLAMTVERLATSPRRSSPLSADSPAAPARWSASNDRRRRRRARDGSGAGRR